MLPAPSATASSVPSALKTAFAAPLKLNEGSETCVRAPPEATEKMATTPD
jgi:hypothetical protein